MLIKTGLVARCVRDLLQGLWPFRLSTESHSKPSQTGLLKTMGIYLTQLKSRVGTSFRYPNKVTRTWIFLAASFFASFILKLVVSIWQAKSQDYVVPIAYDSRGETFLKALVIVSGMSRAGSQGVRFSSTKSHGQSRKGWLSEGRKAGGTKYMSTIPGGALELAEIQTSSQPNKYLPNQCRNTQNRATVEYV